MFVSTKSQMTTYKKWIEMVVSPSLLFQVPGICHQGRRCNIYWRWLYTFEEGKTIPCLLTVSGSGLSSEWKNRLHSSLVNGWCFRFFGFLFDQIKNKMNKMLQKVIYSMVPQSCCHNLTLTRHWLCNSNPMDNTMATHLCQGTKSKFPIVLQV